MTKSFNNYDHIFSQFADSINRTSRKAVMDYPPFVFWTKDINQKDVQNAIISRPETLFNKLLGLYFHIPFCSERCTFCRYPSSTDTRRIDEFLTALHKEIIIYSRLLQNYPIRSLMFGGGTPSLLSAQQLESFLSGLHQNLNLKQVLQSSFEVHPESLTKEKLKVLKTYKIDRISLGIQSMDKTVLKTVHRIQNVDHIKIIYDEARNLGIENIHIDLMTGLPGQTLESFTHDLKTILAWRPSSITVYKFIASSLTPFAKTGHALSETDIKRINTMQDYATKMFRDAGYIHTSGNTTAVLKPGVYTLGVTDQVKYNSSFLGLGPFSNSHLTGAYRYANFGDLDNYIESVNTGRLPIERGIRLTMKKELVAYLFMQLWKGAVSKRAIELLYNTQLDDFPDIMEKLKYLESRGKITIHQHYIKSHMRTQKNLLTYAQYLFCDDIQEKILAMNEHHDE